MRVCRNKTVEQDSILGRFFSRWPCFFSLVAGEDTSGLLSPSNGTVAVMPKHQVYDECL